MRRFNPMAHLLGFTLALVVSAMFASTANANPGFARKYSQPCSSCHLAWPLLNKTGRDFKENGFKFSRDAEPENIISDFLKFDEQFPISAIVKSRPYDKKRSGEEKIRALHEVELIAAGLVAKDISASFEIEAEDENGFDAKVNTAYVTYHPFEFFNVAVAHAPIFGLDPYDTLSSSRRLTRNRSALIDQSFDGADNGGRIRDNRQLLYAYGRPLKQVFYSFGYSGVAGDDEGVNAHVKSGRIAVDVLPNLMIGGFGISGRCKSSAAACGVKDRDFARYGFDAQADFRNFRFMGAYLRANGDRAALSGKDRNHALFALGSYTFRRNGRPWIVPSLRFDNYTKSNGSAHFNEITANLSYYVYENVKVYVEGWQQIGTPSGVSHNGRITFQIEVGF